MRFPLIVGMAALSGAVDFDDDDMNFLRMLSSNATGNTTATTVPAGNTTVAPTTVAPGGNTTVAPAGNTTVAPAGNTTVAPVVTTVASQSNGTVATTVPAGSPPKEDPPKENPPKENPPKGDLCSAGSYNLYGVMEGLPSAKSLAAHAKKQADKVIKVDCDFGNAEYPSAKMKAFGAYVTTDANKKICTDAGGTTKDRKCSSSSEYIRGYSTNSYEMLEGFGMLQYCCGKVSDNPYSMDLQGDVVVSGTLFEGAYADATCTTALKETDVSASTWTSITDHFDGGVSASLELQKCVTGSQRYHKGIDYKIVSCNETYSLATFFFEDGCKEEAEWMDESNMVNSTCRKQESGGNDTFYAKSSCTGTVATHKKVETKIDVTFGSLPPMTDDEKATFKGTYEKTAKDKVEEAAGETVTETPVHTYTGDLKTSRRRLAEKRRLDGHSGTATVDSVFTFSLPAAKAENVEKDITDAKNNGVLKTATFEDAVVADLQKSSLGGSLNLTSLSAAAKVKVDMTVDIAKSISSGGSSSTSAASESASIFGFAAAVAVVAAMLF